MLSGGTERLVSPGQCPGLGPQWFEYRVITATQQPH